MKTNFTKGDWKILNDRIGIIDESNSQAFGMMLEIAYVDMYNFGECEGEANANLIALSPVMFNMLEKLISNSSFQSNMPDEAEEIESILERMK